MNAMTLKEAKMELKTQPKEKERIIKEYTTGECVLIGNVAINTPDKTHYKKGMYNATVLLTKKEGQQLTIDLQNMIQQQYKEHGKGTELAPLTPVIELDDITDKYILRTQTAPQIWEGVDIAKPYIKVVNKELENKMLNGCGIKVNECSFVHLVVRFEAYTTSYSTGVLAVLKGIEVIEPSELYEGKLLN